MKISKIFLKELERPKIDKPKFWDYFSNNEELMFKLLKQYLSTKPKPDLQLYLDRHLPDDDSNARDQPIQKLSGEFYDLIATNKMPREYYSHTIEDTEIYKRLDSVFTIIEDFKDKVLIEDLSFNDKIVFSDKCIKDIIGTLEEIGIIELTKLVLNDFKNDHENIRIDIKCCFNKSINKKEIEYNYRELKRYADNNINDYFDSIKKFNQIWDEICEYKKGRFKP